LIINEETIMSSAEFKNFIKRDESIQARSSIVSKNTWDMVLNGILVLGGITNQQKICGEIIH